MWYTGCSLNVGDNDLANEITTNTIHIDTGSSVLTDFPTSVLAIVMTATGGDATFILQENDTAKETKMTLLQQATDSSTFIDLTAIPIMFTNGVYVSTVTAGGRITLIYKRTGVA